MDEVRINVTCEGKVVGVVCVEQEYFDLILNQGRTSFAESVTLFNAKVLAVSDGKGGVSFLIGPSELERLKLSGAFTPVKPKPHVLGGGRRKIDI